MVYLLFLLILLFSFSSVHAEDRHPLTANDLLDFDRISDPRVSPDGSHIAFVVSSLDLDNNRRRSSIWVMNSNGSEARQLTPLPEGGNHPAWALDGQSVYFISSRSGTAQVWRISLAGGTPQQVTSLPLDVDNLKMSPDGKHLALTMEVFVDCDSLDCTVKRLEQQKAQPATGVVYDKIFVRHWNAWQNGRRGHLFVLPVTGGGPPVDVMAGMDADVPSTPFGGPNEFSFTPDGGGMVFTARNAGREEPWSTNFDLYVVPLDGSAAPVNITKDNIAWDTCPVFSPDGKTLAYRAMRVPCYEADRFRIVLRFWRSSYQDGKFVWSVGDPNWITEEWDRSAESIAWSSHGRSLYVHADNLGQQSFFELNPASGQVKLLVFNGTVSEAAVTGDHIILIREDLSHPTEICSIDQTGADLQQLTHLNDARLAKVSMGKAEQFSFIGANNEPVYGYVMSPPNLNPQAKYPVALIVHGGPQVTLGNTFNYRWNAQVFAGAGYGVIFIDFHGTPGYGQKFTNSITDDWGGKPLKDLQIGLEQALARYPWLDGTRVAALGPSYGGYMIYWIAGNWANRFNCLVAHCGIFNTGTFYATDELWFAEHEFNGTPWNNPEGYQKFNPANHTVAWQTPMLLIHGSLDFRVPIENSLAAFNVLQRKNIPSRFIHFPDESHWIQKPRNTIQWYQAIIDWVNQFCRLPKLAADAAVKPGQIPGAGTLQPSEEDDDYSRL
ncbi:MAG: S9 family peptidase [Deltaproteobacteria bacterium]|nr:S9 family peptidase [Deltaproteobacteria bacterium]